MIVDERITPDLTNGVFATHVHRYWWVMRYAFNARVLDAGCGTGYGADLLVRVAASVHAVDASATTATSNATRYRHPALTFAVVDLEQPLDLPTAGFDLVVSFEVYEHLTLEGAESFLREARRVCRPGGRVILSTPNRLVEAPFVKLAGHVNEFHINSVSPAEFRARLRRHFERVVILGERPRDPRVKRLLKRLDRWNLRHRLLSRRGQARANTLLTGQVQSYGANLTSLEIAPGMLRQSSGLIAVCT